MERNISVSSMIILALHYHKEKKQLIFFTITIYVKIPYNTSWQNITAVVGCIVESGKVKRFSNAKVGVEMIMGLRLATLKCLSLPDHL